MQIVLISSIGSLIGEFFREIHDDEPVVMAKFISSWLASGFLGIMIGLIVKEMFFQDKPLLVLGITGFLSYMGNKNSTSMLSSMIDNFLNNNKGS
ncbi:MAG: hypothetical protein RR420_01495 [Anaerovoracaceae bacterium]